MIVFLSPLEMPSAPAWQLPHPHPSTLCPHLSLTPSSPALFSSCCLFLHLALLSIPPSLAYLSTPLATQSLLYSLSLLPSFYLALLVRALPIYILNLCFSFLCLYNPRINLVYGLQCAAHLGCITGELTQLRSCAILSSSSTTQQNVVEEDPSAQEHEGMLSLPSTLFAPFLGLGFALHMGIKKPAAGEHAQG